MKKLLVVALMLCVGTVGFSQQLLTSLRGGVLLNNKQEVAFDKDATYFYVIKNTDLQLYQTEGVFYVADYYEKGWFDREAPAEEYSGALGFVFNPVLTDKGLAIKINTEVLGWDGLDLKGALLSVTEDETGLKVNFKMTQCYSEKKVAQKSFEVLVPSEKDSLTAQQLSAMAAKKIRLAFTGK